MENQFIEGFGSHDTADEVFETYAVPSESAKNFRIIVAFYEIDGYEGYSVVIYRNLDDGQLYMVEASHCSCNGLEDGWHPVKTTKDAIRLMLTEGRCFARSSQLGEFVTKWLETEDDPTSIRSEIESLKTDVAILRKKFTDLKESEMADLLKERRALIIQKGLLEKALDDLKRSLGA